jgi:hypothetical protein
MIEKIWRFEVWRARLEYWKDSRGICGNIECVEGFCVKR